MVQFSIPFLSPLNQRLWEPDASTSKIIRVITFFSYYGANFSSETGIVISFILLAVIFASYLLFLIAFAIVQSKRGRLPKLIMFIVLLLADFIGPICCSWNFAQAGLLLGKLIEQYDSFYLAAFICIIAVIVACFVLFQFFCFPCVTYHPAQSIFWCAKYNMITILFAGIFGFLNRLSDMLNFIPSIVIQCILLVCGIIFAILFYQGFWFISDTENYILLGITFGSILFGILQIIRDFVSINQNLMFILLPIILIIFVFVSRILLKLRLNKEFQLLNQLEETPEDFSYYIRSPNQLLSLVRVGLNYAHPYVLSSAPFRDGTNTWPNSKDIYEQYLRFIAIYPEENLMTMLVLDAIKKRFRKNYYLKTIRTIGTALIQSRNRHMTSQVKYKLKEFDDYARYYKSLEISYWLSISEGSSSAVYDVVEQLLNQTAEIESNYLHVLNLYPNNWQLCAHFGKALKTLENDYQEASLWFSRASALRNSNLFIDICQEHGLKTFPHLPKYIKSREKQNAQIVINDSVASRSSLSSQISKASTTFSLEDEENDIKNAAISNIREMGLTAPVPFITSIITFVIIFFIIFSVLIVLLSTIPVTITLYSYDNIWRSIDDACNLLTLTSKVHFLMSLDQGRNKGYLLPEENRNNNNMTTKDIIVQCCIDINNALSDVTSDIGYSLDPNSNGVQRFLKATVSFCHEEGVYTNISLLEAFTSLSGYLFQYDENVNDYSEMDWFYFFQKNSISATTPLHTFVSLLHEDFIDDIDNSTNIFLIIIIIFTVLSFLLLICYIFMSINAKKKYEWIISTFSHLPKSAIHQSIAKFSNASVHIELSSEERLYNSEFMKMASLRNSFGGFPLSMLILLFVINVILTIFSGYILYIILAFKTESLSLMMQRYTVLAESTSNVYFYQSYAIHYYGYLMGSPFRGDNMEIANSMMLSLDSSVEETFRDLMIGSESEEGEFNTYSFITCDNSGLIQQLTDISNNIYEDGLDTYDLIDRIPDISFISFIQELVHEITNEFISDSVETGDTAKVQYLNTFIENSWETRTCDKYFPIYTDFMGSAVSDVALLIYILPIILIVVELVLVLIIIYILEKIKKSVHYILSTLAIIDPMIVAQYHELSGMLSGVYNSVSQDMTTAVSSITSFSEEMIVTLDKELKIISINESATTHWELKEIDCIDVAYQLVLIFEDENIYNGIQNLLEHHVPFDPVLNTTVTLISTSKKINCNVFAYPVYEDKILTNIIIILQDQTYIHEKQEILQQYLIESEKIKRDIFPKQISNLIDIETEPILYQTKNIVIIVIQINEFDEILQDQNALNTFKQYREIFDECINNTDDASYIKTIGVSDYIIFNISGKINDETIVLNTALNFCNELNHRLNQLGISIKGGLASDYNSTVGMITSNHLSFDVFEHSMHMARVLARNASPNTIVLANKESQSVFRTSHVQLRQKEIILNTARFAAYEYPLL